MKNVKMRITYIIIIFVLGSINFSYSQKSHLLVLRKAPTSLVRAYTYSKTFPRDWVKKKWDESYAIIRVNFKDGEWFVLMVRTKSNIPQSYHFSPTNSFIKEKLKDGYQIQDICMSVANNRIKYLYVFSKLSTSPVDNYYYSGKASLGYGGGAQKYTLTELFKRGRKNGYSFGVQKV